MEIDSYGGAIGKLLPGTFVPDIAPHKAPASTGLPDAGAGATASFRDTVKSLMDDVNTKLTDASQKSQDLATGASNDFEGTVKSIEEATLTFQFTEQVRNKLMEAYTEIERIQI